MEKSTFVLVVISFCLLFACVIEATEKNLQDETSGLLWSRRPADADKPATVGPKAWSPSQRMIFRMLPKNVPIPPSGPSRGESPPTPHDHFIMHTRRN